MYSCLLTSGNILYYYLGNIGIGTNTPAYKLDVVGSGHFSANLFVSGTITNTTLTTQLNTISSSINTLINCTGNISSGGILTNQN